MDCKIKRFHLQAIHLKKCIKVFPVDAGGDTGTFWGETNEFMGGSTKIRGGTGVFTGETSLFLCERVINIKTRTVKRACQVEPALLNKC
jgi:hypothetical protein